MNVLLLRPVPANERFGLGPFFRIEPLGMEYIAAALEAHGHRVTLADLRFTSSVAGQLRASRPELRVMYMSGYSPDLATPDTALDGPLLIKPFTREG